VLGRNRPTPPCLRWQKLWRRSVERDLPVVAREAFLRRL